MRYFWLCLICAVGVILFFMTYYGLPTHQFRPTLLWNLAFFTGMFAFMAYTRPDRAVLERRIDELHQHNRWQVSQIALADKQRNEAIQDRDNILERFEAERHANAEQARLADIRIENLSSAVQNRDFQIEALEKLYRELLRQEKA